MNLSNLMQFDQEQFLKLFGVYLRDCRKNRGLSVEQFAKILKMLSPDEVIQLEMGLKTLSEVEFNLLCDSLNLDKKEIINIAKITQVQYLFSMQKEINAEL